MANITSRSLSDVMNMMKPLFRLDTKSQRTFMACLNFDDLALAMQERDILIETKLATLQHFFGLAEYSRQV